MRIGGTIYIRRRERRRRCKVTSRFSASPEDHPIVGGIYNRASSSDVRVVRLPRYEDNST